MYVIKNIIDAGRDRWNDFIAHSATGGFTQSFEWADFMATQREKIWRLAIEKDGSWRGVIFFFKSRLKFNQSFFYSPRGPVFADENSDEENFGIFKFIVEYIDNLAREEGAMYFQTDPLISNNAWCGYFDRLGFQKSMMDIQPRHTLILDIRKDEDELLKQMHQKTRYNIGIAQKNGINVIVDNDKFREFYELLKDTMQRQKIKLFPENYFKQILHVPFVKLYLAEYQGKIIAGNIMIFWNDTATYLFGAMDYNFRQIMAPHLLQWRAIKDAKKANLWFYDFWGAAPKDARGREENWAGFTKFKIGFSPDAEITEYIGAYEKVYLPIQLGVYRTIRKLF